MVAGNTEQATAARVAAADTAVVGDGGRVRVAFSAAGCLVVAAVAVGGGGGGAVVACTGVWQCRRVSWTVLFDVCVCVYNEWYVYI